MAFPRTSGILLHPTSLPGRYGIGDLGAQAYRFVDFLIETQQTLWQILPLGPTGHGNSPYMCYSAMAGNPLLINLENLQSQGLLTAEELALTSPFSAVAVDYEAVGVFKLDALRKAASRFKKAADPTIEAEYKQFIKESSDWLEDYALFMAIKTVNDNKPLVAVGCGVGSSQARSHEPHAVRAKRRDFVSRVHAVSILATVARTKKPTPMTTAFKSWVTCLFT